MASQKDTRADLSSRNVADRIKEEGRQRLERGKSSAAEHVEHVASALKSAGSEFGHQSALGSYANQLAEGIGRFGSRLRDSSIEDLAADLQSAARRNPAAFVLGGLALGIALARIVKASAPPSDRYDYDSALGDELTGSGDTHRSGVVTEAPTADVAGTSDVPGSADPNRFGG